MSLEKYEQDLERMIEDAKERHKNLKEIAEQRIAKYNQTLKNKKSSEAEQVRALLGRVIEYSDLEKNSTEIIHLTLIGLLTNHVQIIKIEVATAIMKLEESGILQKKDLEDLKKTKNKIDEFQQLLTERYERAKQTEESRNKDLPYVS